MFGVFGRNKYLYIEINIFGLGDISQEHILQKNLTKLISLDSRPLSIEKDGERDWDRS